MATLTPQDLGEMLRNLRRDHEGWLAQMTEHPNKFETLALLQGLENWFESERANIKTAMQTEAGISISNTLAEKLGKVWLQWKFGGE